MTWKKISLIVLGSFLVSFASYYIFNRFFRENSTDIPAALHVESQGNPLTVVLDNTVLGKTPFHSEKLKEGVGSFVLSSEESSLRTKINLVAGTLTVVNWDLGPSEVFSEGEIIWLEKINSGLSLVVFGSPEGAEVRVDEEFIGTTPVSSDKIVAGDHTVKISKQGYNSRILNIKVQEGYKLSVKFQLFLIPGPLELPIAAFPTEPRYTLKSIESSDPILYSDTKSWVRGLLYFWSKNTQAFPEGSSIDYFVDFEGRIFDSSGFKLAEASEITEKEKLTIGYLGRKSDGGLTEEAKRSLIEFSRKSLVSQEMVEIIPTGTGWLRVRASPSLTAEEVARVNIGEKLVFLEEQGNWYQVKLPDGKTGWISAAFAKKL